MPVLQAPPVDLSTWPFPVAYPLHWALHSGTAGTAERRNDLIVAAGDGPDGQRWFEQGLQIRQRLADADPGNAGFPHDPWVTGWSYIGLATRLQQLDRAMPHWNQAITLAMNVLQRLGQRAPVSWRQEAATMLDLRASCLDGLHQPEAAAADRAAAARLRKQH